MFVSARAFSSEVDTVSREENAKKLKTAEPDFKELDPAMGKKLCLSQIWAFEAITLLSHLRRRRAFHTGILRFGA